jgi:hypothetical protein
MKIETVLYFEHPNSCFSSENVSSGDIMLFTGKIESVTRKVMKPKILTKYVIWRVSQALRNVMKSKIFSSLQCWYA